jgi:hypothetical protein
MKMQDDGQAPVLRPGAKRLRPRRTHVSVRSREWYSVVLCSEVRAEMVVGTSTEIGLLLLLTIGCSLKLRVLDNGVNRWVAPIVPIPIRGGSFLRWLI